MGNDNSLLSSNILDKDIFLNRESVNKLIVSSMNKPIIIVNAGPGFGKTSAVSMALNNIDCKYIWIQFTSLDNLIAKFWEQFAISFKKTSVTLMNKLKLLGYPTTAAAFYQVITFIKKEILEKQKLILVLDDFHNITNKTVLNFIEMIISENLDNLSIVIITRTKPTFNLTSMLSKNKLANITEDDLRFTKDETNEYLYQQGIRIDKQTLDALYYHTEGWIIAIYLIGLSIKNSSTSIDKLINYSKIDIFGLIENEIYNIASPMLKDMLIKMSFLEPLPADLIYELSDDGAKIVSELSQASLLVRRDPTTDTFHIHNLFKSFLKSKQKLLVIEDINRMYFKVATWYELNNRPIEAVHNYRICKRYDKIFDIILAIKGRESHEVNLSFIEIIDEAPEDSIKKCPLIRIVKAHLLFNNDNIQDATDYLNDIHKEYRAKKQTKETLAILGEAYIMLALISLVEQNFEFVEYFKLADKYLPNGSVLVDNSLSIAEGLNICGIRNPIEGELQRYKTAIFEAASYATRVMNGGGYGMEYLSAADIAIMIGDMKEAEKNAYEAIFRASANKQFDIEFMAYFYLIRIFISRGNYMQIKGILLLLEEKAENINSSIISTLLDIIKGWYYVKINKTEKVAAWIMDEEKTRKLLAPVILGREYLVRSDSFLAQGRFYELLAFMEQQDITYKRRGILYALIQNEITRSIIYYYLGNKEKSLSSLENAYNLSSPNNLIFQYIEYGAKMRTVINAAKTSEDCKIPKDWLDSISTKSNTYAKMLSKVIASSNGTSTNPSNITLTTREREVLLYFCDGLTREEIADTCNLSPNTVKTVLQNISSKLGAVNNIDAVRIATMLGLI